MHWATQYIGRPWVSGARGPEAFDCWGLVRYVYGEHLNVLLPLYPYNAKDVLKVSGTMRTDLATQWQELDEPEDMCLVAMSARKLPHHVGLFLAVDGGLVLHCGEKQNVTCQTIDAIRQTTIYSSLRFFRYGALCNSNKSL